MKKNHSFGPLIFLFLIVLLTSLSGCGRQKPVDTSERQFCVIHFNGDIKTRRTLSATNGNDIFYVDGNEIINYQTGKSIAPVEGKICTLTASDRKLYVLYENNEVRAYDFDGNRLDVLQGQNVLGIAAVNDMVFYSTADAPLYFKEPEPPKVPVAVPSPQKDEESSINWGRVGERALGAVAIVGGTVLILYIH